MKFSAKTVMKTATFRDVSLARAQGTLVKDPLSGYRENSRGPYRMTMLRNYLGFFFFIGTTIAMIASLYLLYMVARQSNYSFASGSPEDDSTIQESLMGGEATVSL